MTNREFYKEQILDVACRGKNIGFDKRTNKLCICEELKDCHNCLFCRSNTNNCEVSVKEWSNEEYKEPCEFEKDELVEVSDDREMWHLRYFSHINSDGTFVTFYNQKNSEGTILTTSWNYCRKYGTLGGLKKEDIRKFAKWIINNYLVVGELSEYTTDEILGEYEKEQTNE